MPQQPLPPDPQSQKRWHTLEQPTPSKQAYPPAMSGGQAWLKWLLIFGIIAAIIALLSRGTG